ncbi:MAG: 2,3,4,5-tetrahydropyridine-2,6-dicarboxylate N-succinyltransferase [Acidimicrobiales bacterium]
MDIESLNRDIVSLWERRDSLTERDAAARDRVFDALELLDQGTLRVAEVAEDGEVVVHAWLKQAILLAFRLRGMTISEIGPFVYRDRLPLKRSYGSSGVRVVPGASARFGSYLGRGVTLMPSYVNIGAYIGDNTMVDTWATVGSCAQIGRNVHLSGGVGIGGVLEPPQASPVIIEDDAFIGSRAMVTEGARVGVGAVVGAGVILNPSIPVIDTETGEELGRGIIPPWSVAVSGTRMKSFPGGTFGLGCVLVIKRLVEGERHSKTVLNEILRDHGAAL